MGLNVSPGFYLSTNQSVLATNLFGMSVDLEWVLEQKRKVFRSQIDSFIAEIEERRKGISFQPRNISVPVSDDERVTGLYSFLLGFFGYERRRKKTRYVQTQQLHTPDIKRKIDSFVTDARKLFEEKFHQVVDVDSALGECMKLAAGRLGNEELIVLRAVIRRSFSKLAATPWHVAPEIKGPQGLLREPSEIEEASEHARLDFDRICGALVAHAQVARQEFEEAIEKILLGVKEQLVIACLDRNQMEQALNMAMMHEMQLKLSSFREPRSVESALKLITPGDRDYRRLLLSGSNLSKLDK